MDFYFDGAWRMDWGLGNPNKTAVLIACLMLAVWAIAFVWRSGFWIALVASNVLGACLVQTYSRGGAVAFSTGVVILLAWGPRPWPLMRVSAVVASLCLLCCCIVHVRANERYALGFLRNDPSIDNRLVIWRRFPEMFAAAPTGWGWGRAGDSYTQWFQPVGQPRNYLNLINSHFTWMAEGGWLFSFFYIFAWAMVLLACWPAADSKFGPVPLAVWIALGIGGFFSHVEESPWLWLVPLILLACASWERIRLQRGNPLRGIVFGGFFSAAVVLGLVAAGSAQKVPSIVDRSGVVALGSGSATSLILVDRTVLGKYYGHALRQYIAEHPDLASSWTYLVSESLGHLPAGHVDQLVLAGNFLRDPRMAPLYACARRIIVINPLGFPQEAAWNVGLSPQAEIYIGEYSQTPSRSAWFALPHVECHEIGGAGEFVPGWPATIWKPGGA